MNRVKLYLIRHGKTKGNEKRLYCGITDLELSEIGKSELVLQKDIYSKVIRKCDGYYTTGLKRTNQTMEILFTKDFKIEKDFREYNFGDFEMKSYNELKNIKPYIDWITDEAGDFIIPNGESKKQFRNRINEAFKNFLNKLVLENKKSSLLVCHGGTIGTILELFYSNNKNFYEWQPSFGRGYSLDIYFDNKEIKIYNINEI